jgi:hypothetical protein
VRATFNVVESSGAPRELGRVHGEAARGWIAQGVDAWSEVTGRHTGMTTRSYVESFLNATDFTKAIEYFTPALLEEVRGIAEGAGLPFETVLAYQMMDEEWAYRVEVTRDRRHRGESCSAAGVLRSDGTAVIGQNMDLPRHYDGTQVLLSARPADGPAVMVFTPAGMIGTCGLNERGVGVCVNALSHLRHGHAGLPVAFVLRGALAQRSARDAASLLKTVPHATGQNYLVADGERVEDYECSPGGAVEVPAAAAQVAHTNHVLMSTDVDPAVGDEAHSTTIERLASVRSDLGALGADATFADLMRALSDTNVPVCVPRGAAWMTLGSVVMELGPEPVLHVALGPPADTPYTRVTFQA